MKFTKPYNCGWNLYEGSAAYSENPKVLFEKTLPPIFEYHNDSENKQTPGRAIVAGYYVKDKNVFVFADFVSKYVYILQPHDDQKMWTQVGKVETSDTILSLGKTDDKLFVLNSDGVYSLEL